METEVIRLGLKIEIEDDMPKAIVNIGLEAGFMEMIKKEEEDRLEELLEQVGNIVIGVMERNVKEEYKRRNKNHEIDDLIKELEEFRTLLKEIKNEGLNN